MPTQSNQANLIQLLRRIPPKWALAIVGVVLAYWLGQPILNRTLGWNLPTIAALLGEGQPRSKPDPSETRAASAESISTDARVDKSSSTSTKPRSLDPSAPVPVPLDENESERRADTKRNESKPPAAKPNNTTKPSNATKPKNYAESKSSAKPNKPTSQVSDFLTEVGPDRYRSPAGLFYTRGSEEGHRLKHIAKHLEDQPTRPGSHGVFDGDLNQALHWIDEAFQKATKGDRSARTSKEGESTKYEVTFDKPIGYVGGSDGKRKGNPPTKRLRLIVIGQNVITAFPF